MFIRNFILLISISLTPIVWGNDYYVSTSGNDLNPGTELQPFRTVNAALQIVDGGDTIYLREGTYRESINLSNFDGTTSENNKLTIKNYPNEKPIINGTDEIYGGWSEHEGSIYSIDYTNAISQLFVEVNGETIQAVIARWPNVTSNFNYPFEYPTEKIDNNFTYNDLGAAAGGTTLPSTFNDSQLSQISGLDLTGAKIWLNPGARYYSTTETIDSKTAGSISFTANYSNLGNCYPAKATPYFLHSDLDLLDHEYEWYQENGKLYFIAPGYADPNDFKIMIRTRDVGLSRTISHLNLEGIDFFATTIDLKGDYNTVKSCNFNYPKAFYNNVKKYGGEAGLNVQGNFNLVTKCEISNSWGSGIHMRNASQDGTLEDCLIHDCNWSSSICPGAWISGTRMTIKNNTIYSVGRSGIRFYDIYASSIEGNHIYDYGKLSWDLGAIKGGQPDYQGSVFYHNYHHDPDPDGKHAGGIYLDHSSGNAVVHYNVSYNAKGINMNGYATNNHVYNNTYIRLTSTDNEAGEVWSHFQRYDYWDYLEVNAANNFTTNDLHIEHPDTTLGGFDYTTNTGTNPFDDTNDAVNIVTTGKPDKKVVDGEFNNRIIKNNIEGMKLAGPEYGDFRPLPGSPCIDTGSILSSDYTPTYPGSIPLNYEITEFEGAAPDAGAYEYGATGETGNWIAGITWSPEWNSAPIPEITATQDLNNTNTFVFSAESSSDQEGWIMRYDWDFGDGETLYGKTVQHTFQNTGNFTVTLTVRDDLAAVATTQVTVKVPIHFSVSKLVHQPIPTAVINISSENSSGDIELYVGEYNAGQDPTGWDYSFTKTGITDLSQPISVEMSNSLLDGKKYYARVKVIGNASTEWTEVKTFSLDRLNSLPISSNLLVHLAASDRRLTADSQLSEWQGLSGTTLNATTSGTGPTVKSSELYQIKGMNSLHFYNSPMTIDTGITAAGDVTTFVAVRIQVEDDEGNDFQRFISTAGITNDHKDGGWQSNKTHVTVGPNIAVLKVVNTSNSNLGTIHLGENSVKSGQELYGEILEVAIYDSVLVNADATVIENWLTAKWSTANTFPEPTADWDGDGFTNAEEAVNGTDPSIANIDSDKDGASDREEILAGTDLNDFFDRPDFEDSDFDGLSDTLEALLNSDPLKQDSDDDGFMDKIEFQANSQLDKTLSIPTLGTQVIGNSAYGFEEFDGSEFITQSGRIDGTPQAMATSSDNVEWIFEENASISDTRDVGASNGSNVLMLGYVSDLSGSGLTQAQGSVTIRPEVNQGFGTLTFETNAFKSKNDKSTYKIKVDYFDNSTKIWTPLTSQIITDNDGGGQESRSITIDKNFQQADAIKITAFEVTPQGSLNNTTGVFIDDVALTSYSENIQEPEPTPVLGLEIEQNGSTLTWSCESLIDVKEFRIIDRKTGQVVGIVLPTESNIYQFELESVIDVFLVVVDNGGTEQYFTPSNGNQITTVYNLQTGWNLIALKGKNIEIEGLTDFTSGSLWIWNGKDYETTTNPEPNQALWVYSQIDQKVVVNSQKSISELSLTNGWNLVGISENRKIPTEALAVYSWQGFYTKVDLSALLLEGQAYWIFVL